MKTEAAVKSLFPDFTIQLLLNLSCFLRKCNGMQIIFYLNLDDFDRLHFRSRNPFYTGCHDIHIWAFVSYSVTVLNHLFEAPRGTLAKIVEGVESSNDIALRTPRSILRQGNERARL